MEQGSAPVTSETGSLGARYSAHNRDRGRGFIYGDQQRIEAMQELMPTTPVKRVLDVGCRDGALAARLRLKVEVLVGVDIDVDALNVAVTSGILFPVCANLWTGALPFRDGEFDLVIAGEVVEHMPFPDHLVSEIARVLSPGGRVVGSVPNSFRLKNRLRFLAGRPYETDPTHLHQFSPTALRNLLSAHFSRVQIVPAVGRFVRLSPRLMANDLVWAAEVR